MREGNTWEHSQEIFAAALAMPEAERAAFVRRQCDGRPELRDQVLQLLGAHEQMGAFLEAPALDFRGQMFGAYRAVREVGRGGMSVVYEGERAEGGFEKTVAIKVLMLQTAAPPSRSETQILAGLEHPNIARLLDAGTTELGFRYLVMEFVEGQTITDYCRRGLSEASKLRRFLDVCAAVHHAHRSLVVHRDLKPDNILVNSEGAPKLLDFGIAKMLSEGDAAAAQTRGIRAYTADYASPEQILGQPVTTSSDVYSLGVLLCELIGGRVPRAMAGLEVAALVDAAQNREVAEVPLAGDLAAIAHKALRREPGERYESASALGRDVERYLSGLTVEARAPSWSYSAGKFIRRRKYAVSAVVLAGAALTAATGIAVWQARLAGTRFEQVRRLARSVMFELYDAVTPLPGSLAARQLLVTRSLEYLRALENDTRASEDVQLDVARGYLRLSEIQGRNYAGATVGSVADALKSAGSAVAIARRVLAGNSGSMPALTVLAEALEYSATAQLLRREDDTALALAGEAVAVGGELLVRNPADRDAQKRLATLIKQLASVYDAKRDFKQAIPLYQRSLDMRRKIYEADPQDNEAFRRYAEGHHWLGQAYVATGELTNAETNAREAYRLEKVRAERAGQRMAALPNLASAISLLGGVAGRKKQYGEAIVWYRELLDIRRELLTTEPKSAVAALRLAAALDRLGNTVGLLGRPAEGLPMLREALMRARAVLAHDAENSTAAREVSFALQDLGRAYDRLGDAARACAAVTEALAMLDGPWKKLGPEARTSYAGEIATRRRCR